MARRQDEVSQDCGTPAGPQLNGAEESGRSAGTRRTMEETRMERGELTKDVWRVPQKLDPLAKGSTGSLALCAILTARAPSERGDGQALRIE